MLDRHLHHLPVAPGQRLLKTKIEKDPRESFRRVTGDAKSVDPVGSWRAVV